MKRFTALLLAALLLCPMLAGCAASDKPAPEESSALPAETAPVSEPPESAQTGAQTQPDDPEAPAEDAPTQAPEPAAERAEIPAERAETPQPDAKRTPPPGMVSPPAAWETPLPTPGSVPPRKP